MGVGHGLTTGWVCVCVLAWSTVNGLDCPAASAAAASTVVIEVFTPESFADNVTGALTAEGDDADAFRDELKSQGGALLANLAAFSSGE